MEGMLKQLIFMIYNYNSPSSIIILHVYYTGSFYHRQLYNFFPGFHRNNNNAKRTIITIIQLNK